MQNGILRAQLCGHRCRAKADQISRFGVGETEPHVTSGGSREPGRGHGHARAPFPRTFFLRILVPSVATHAMAHCMMCHIAPRCAQRAEKLHMQQVASDLPAAGVRQWLRMKPGGEVTA